MEQHKPALEAAGLQLVAIALGEPKHAERYCGELAPTQTCLASTSNDPYYAWGLYQFSNLDLLTKGGKLLKAGQQAYAAGHRQGAATGDAKMSSGTFIVDAGGVVRYTYYSDVPGDDPAIDALIAAATAITA